MYRPGGQGCTGQEARGGEVPGGDPGTHLPGYPPTPLYHLPGYPPHPGTPPRTTPVPTYRSTPHGEHRTPYGHRYPGDQNLTESGTRMYHTWPEAITRINVNKLLLMA